MGERDHARMAHATLLVAFLLGGTAAHAASDTGKPLQDKVTTPTAKLASVPSATADAAAVTGAPRAAAKLAPPPRAAKPQASYPTVPTVQLGLGCSNAE